MRSARNPRCGLHHGFAAFVLVLQACAPSVEGIASPAVAGSAQPHLAQHADTVVLSWVEEDDETATLRFSLLRGDSWSAPATVASGSGWFVNWADFPSVVPIDGDFWAAHWLAKKPGGTYAYDIQVAVSTDAGATWSEPRKPHLDDTPTEHGFVSLFPLGDAAGALWLDGRNMDADGDTHAGETHGGGGNMTLRAAAITRAGAPDGGVVVDEMVCDCCQTSVAIAASGPVAVYRDRSADEIRDIYAAPLTGGRWQAGRPVARDNWEIPGCPVNGPAIAARGNDVVVAWFTAANDQPAVRLARSADGGQNFDDAIDVETGAPLGRVGVVLARGGAAAVSYLRRDRSGGGAQIVARKVGASGAVGAARIIAKNSGSRSAGFPQIGVAGDDLVFAWTDARGDRPVVMTALLRGGIDAL